jgi:hypothetical protein
MIKLVANSAMYFALLWFKKRKWGVRYCVSFDVWKWGWCQLTPVVIYQLPSYGTGCNAALEDCLLLDQILEESIYGTRSMISFYVTKLDRLNESFIFIFLVVFWECNLLGRRRNHNQFRESSHGVFKTKGRRCSCYCQDEHYARALSSWIFQPLTSDAAYFPPQTGTQVFQTVSQSLLFNRNFT